MLKAVSFYIIVCIAYMACEMLFQQDYHDSITEAKRRYKMENSPTYKSIVSIIFLIFSPIFSPIVLVERLFGISYWEDILKEIEDENG